MAVDDAVGVSRRPLISSTLWGPALLVLAACAAILYYGLQVAQTLEASVAASARAGGLSTANEIAGFLDREHERLRAFAEEKQDEIREILAFPDNWSAIDALQVSIKRMFRGAFAFTVTGADGKPLFEDFDGLVGPVCQAAMRDYLAASGHEGEPFELPPIHPVPDAYHFDLISPWALDDGQRGLFFVSISPNRIAELIAAAEQASGNRIVLVSREDPTLIEVSSAGGRDKLGGDFRLDPASLTPGYFAADLPGTSWRLIVMPGGAELAAAVHNVYLKVAASIVALLLISIALMYVIRRAEKRNSTLFTRSLQSSVSRQRAILQSMVDGMVTINAAGEVLNVNSAVTRLFGYEPDELIGGNVKRLMPEPDHSAHDGYLRNYIDTGESHILGRGREAMARRKDGSLFPVLLTLGESLEGDERIFVGILHDMSAYREAQHKLAAQATTIERSRHELDEISQVASKDLQLPLQRIASLSELLGSEQSAEFGDVERAQLKNLGAEVRDMSELAKGIADYARADDRPAAQEIDLGEMLEMVSNDLAARIEETGASIRVQGSGGVIGDPNQIRQLLWNLVDNALKFRDSARAPRILVEIDDVEDLSDGKQSMRGIRVRDNGIGIPEHEFESVFEAFRRLHPREDYPGMGLGLSFCRKITDSLGGEISVTSTLGEGSEFLVSLPAAD